MREAGSIDVRLKGVTSRTFVIDEVDSVVGNRCADGYDADFRPIESRSVDVLLERDAATF
jgi:hypothetical protein